jgi:predicted MFS family arabinose efflux permease
MSAPTAHPAAPASVPSERLLLFTLAAINFTHIVDYVIIMPLGPEFMRDFHITPGQFGFLVASYSFSAGALGFAAGFVMDRFDRKTALLTLYAGFGVGTLSCAIAPNYPLLLVARIVAGAFGGVAGSVILAIVGDVIPAHRRGHAMSIVMNAYSLAQIVGLPLGLWLASVLSWHTPFILIAAVAIINSVVGWRSLPPLRGHLQAGRPADGLAQMRAILSLPNHWRAFALISAVTLMGGLIFPYMTPTLVMNAGLAEKQVPWIYVCGGVATFFAMTWFGRLSDRHGHLRMFTLLTLICLPPMVAFTNLPPVPLWLALAVSTVFIVTMSGRYVPSITMVTGSAERRLRGGFMSVNASVQQIAGAAGNTVAALLVGEDAAGRITGFPLVGALAVATAIAAIFLARPLRAAPDDPAEVAPLAGAEPHFG